MTTIDERGRAAANELRRSMDQGFDVEAGLASVLREETVVDMDAPSVPPRRTWMLWSAAAAVVAIAMVGVFVLREPDEPDEVDVTDVPTTPLPVVPVPTTSEVVVDTTGVPVEVVEVVETTLVPDTSPDTTAPVVERTVSVADVVHVVEPRRSVLVSGTFGDGLGQLAIEDCQECDPARPWAPITIPSGPRGKVLVADTANRRWMLFQPENPDDAGSPWVASEFSWNGVYAMTSQPVIDDAGVVYAVMYGPFGEGGTNSYELWLYDALGDLAEPIERYPAPGIGNLPIVLQPTEVSVGSQVIDGVTPTIARRASIVVGDENRVELRFGEMRSTFLYGTVVQPQWFGPMPGLADGTGLVFVLADGQPLVDRLGTDGTVMRIVVPPSVSVWGAAFATEDGFLRLEASIDGSSWEIVRYELPSFEVYTSPAPPSDRAAAVFGSVGSRASASEWMAAAVAALGDEFRDDCADPAVSDPSASAQQLADFVRASFVIDIGCDDSGGGYRWVVELEQGAGGWSPGRITEEIICRRGVTLDGDTELCV